MHIAIQQHNNSTTITLAQQFKLGTWKPVGQCVKHWCWFSQNKHTRCVCGDIKATAGSVAFPKLHCQSSKLEWQMITDEISKFLQNNNTTMVGICYQLAIATENLIMRQVILLCSTSYGRGNVHYAPTTRFSKRTFVFGGNTRVYRQISILALGDFAFRRT